MISREYIAELSRRVDIEELVSSYVPLKRAGRLLKGLCPFHNEKTPSFTVYPEDSHFYCFGCQSGGDAISFVMRLQNLDYPEAVRALAARVGMPMPDENDEQAKQRGRVLAINRESARLYVESLNTEAGREARGYLRQRKLADGVIRHFGIGFAPDKFGFIRDRLMRQGYTEAELVAAGICKKSEKGLVYDAFRNRIIFPIIDQRGNVIAFGGRQIANTGPKYLNSSDTPVFKKSRNLFALNFAKKALAKDNDRRFILVEGYMDVISLHQEGFSTAVAALGTALTAEQAKLISTYADEVVICYDSDEAGQRATGRAINIFKTTPVKARVLTLPDAKDPDEYIKKHGADRFRQLLEGSGNTIEYALARKKREFDLTQPDGRAAYINEALEILAAEAKPAEQDIYAGRVAEETDVAKSALLAQLDGVNRKRRRQAAREREKRMKDEGLSAASVTLPAVGNGDRALGMVFAEQQLVAAMLKNPEESFPLVESGGIGSEQFLSPEMAEVFELIRQIHREGIPVELSQLSGELPEKTMTLLGRVLAHNYDIGFSKEDVELFISRIQSGRNSPGKVAEMSPEEMQRHFESLKDKKIDT